MNIGLTLYWSHIFKYTDQNLNYISTLFLGELKTISKPLKSPIIHHPASFQADARSRDHLLISGIIEQHIRVGLMECKRKCEEFGTKCQSFSMSESEKRCFLHDVTRDHAFKADYVYKKGYVYYERM